MSESPHLGLPYLAPAQAQKHVTVNEALRRLDGLVQLGVLDRTLTAPPVAPDEGDRHIVADGATGAWAGQSGRIATFHDGAWRFVAPKPGWLAYAAAEARLLVFVGGAWVDAIGALGTLDDLDMLGIGTTADTTNRLAVASEAALFTHAGAGVQAKLNKAAASDTASVLFQTGFSGRAEFGLVGSDAFQLKVSADGSTWTTALAFDAATGAAAFPRSPQQAQVDVFTAGGTWTRPAWAGRAVVLLIGGGGGGGGGACGDASAIRAGGAGGGAGAVTVEEFSAAEITSGCTVIVGTGGAGGAGIAAGGAGSGSAGSAGGTTAFRLNGSGSGQQALIAPGGAGGAGGAASASAGGTGGSGSYGQSNAGGAGGASAAGSGASASSFPAGPGGGGGAGGLATTTATGGLAGAAGAAGYLIGSVLRQSAAGPGGPAGSGGGAGAAKAWTRGMGAGGGGGGSHATAAAGAGGDGGGPGGGGGGGGAGRPAGGSATGGKGGDGACVIVSWAM